MTARQFAALVVAPVVLLVAGFSRYAIPEQVRLIDALPRTRVGKMNKRLLRETVNV